MPKNRKKTIYLIRHAESEANTSGTRDAGEAPLSDRGRMQAQYIAERLTAVGLEAVYTSPMRRALQTALAISTKTNAPVKEVPEVAERRYPSVLLGLHRDSPEAKEYYAAYRRAWLSGDRFEDGETFAEFADRIKRALLLFAEAPEETFAVVSHSFMTKGILAFILHGKRFRPEDIFTLYHRLHLSNTGVTVLTYDPEIKQWSIRTINDHAHLAEPKTTHTSPMRVPKVVTIGGGTGQYTLLRGLKKYPLDITAIVSMADDGGTTGVLRDELGVLPPTDVRKCLVALSDATPLLRELFMYRFPNKDLEGHTIGNLLLTALEKITGDFTRAIEEAGRLFHIKGRVLPVTTQDMRLKIYLKNGEVLTGEKMLDDNPRVRKFGIEKIALQAPVSITRAAFEAIAEADMVVIGPGDLYGSVLPNMLVSGMAQALTETKAPVIFVANLTNKAGQTPGFRADTFVEVLHRYLQKEVVDILLYNRKEPDPDVRARYRAQEGEGMFVRPPQEGAALPYQVVGKDLLAEEAFVPQAGDTLAHTRSFIRHDPDLLAQEIVRLLR